MKRFEKVIVIGGTGLLYQAAQIMLDSEISDEVCVYECNSNGIAKRIDERIKVRVTDTKKELMSALENEKCDSLVLSVMNPYIITEAVIDNPSLFILNLHHAILPYHRGRNCEAWAIYCGDSEAGITWHRVNAGVDTGEIYLQKTVPITDKTTSLRLLTQLNRIAMEGLKELIETGFDNLRVTAVNDSDKGQLHMLRDIPNNAQLNLSASGEEISRFLRAMDYGILAVLGKPYVTFEGRNYEWQSYTVTQCESDCNSVTFNKEENALQIKKAGILITLKQMKGI